MGEMLTSKYMRTMPVRIKAPKFTEMAPLKKPGKVLDN